MKAIIFPGQGSQKAGMASEFYSNFKIVKEIFDRADEALKFSLKKIILDGSDEDLKKTEITQPAILITSISIFRVLKEEFDFDLSTIKYLAGHSLGEYSALVASGSLNLEDQKEHIDMLIDLLEKQKVMYTRLSLSDDPMAINMKNNLRKSVTTLGFPEGTDITVLFEGMKATIDNLKQQVDSR